MALLKCALLTDGSSDVVLLPILEWTIRQHVGEIAVQCEWADLRRLPSQPHGLAARIVKAVELYPCNMLFVHRDAEGQDPERRFEEISVAVHIAADQGFNLPHVCVVPVRMQEAWLLLDSSAIRNAADNPNGKAQLNLPLPRRIEALPDPKEVLYQSLKAASGLSGRRLKRFRPEQRAHSVPRYMTDFCVLRQLPAFIRMEEDIRSVVENLNEDA